MTKEQAYEMATNVYYGQVSMYMDNEDRITEIIDRIFDDFEKDNLVAVYKDNTELESDNIKLSIKLRKINEILSK